MRNVIFFILTLALFSCDRNNDWPPPTGFSAILMNSDSTSVLTSKKDILTVSYKEGDIVRQFYDIKVENQNDYYTFSSLSLFGHINEPLYINCKEKVDTLIFLQTPSYEDEPLEVTFNGKRIYIEKYQGLIYLVR